MLVQRLASARPLVALRVHSLFPLAATVTARSFRVGFPRGPMLEPLDPEYYPSHSDTTDPGLNGGYANPPFEKRQFRDPYGDWWDKQERRNFNEPVHEDNDILGRFSPEEYTWTTPGKGFVMTGTFLAAFFGVCGTVYAFYPDKPAVPRTFPHNGLEAALGGPGAVPATPNNER